MKRIIMDISNQQSRIALTDNNILKEFYVGGENHKRVVGNIYKGRVENILPGMQAAFIDIGIEKNAFLYVKDADDNTSIHKILKKGQEILVQVVKEPIANKGARVNTNITLPGRYIVLMPNLNYIGLSRRIKEEAERERLKTIAQENKPEEMGVIIRTDAQGIEEEKIISDLNFLIRLWKKIMIKNRLYIGPRLIHSELELPYRIVRDLFTKEIDEFVINSKEHYDKVIEMVDYISSGLKDRIKYFNGGHQLFNHYNINSQIEQIYFNKVWLKCGGNIVIDQTEALTVIDVNTGKFVGKLSLQETVLKTNLEAAQEIANQLRLRSIGGIIVVDFIDMKDPQDEIRVLNKLEEFFKEDKTKTNVMGITQLGLVEITRKKTRKPLGRILQTPCPVCEGTGKVISMNTLLIQIDEILGENIYLKSEKSLKVLAHPYITFRLMANEDNILEKLQGKYNINFEITQDENLAMNQIKITRI